MKPLSHINVLRGGRLMVNIPSVPSEVYFRTIALTSGLVPPSLHAGFQRRCLSCCSAVQEHGELASADRDTQPAGRWFGGATAQQYGHTLRLTSLFYVYNLKQGAPHPLQARRLGTLREVICTHSSRTVDWCYIKVSKVQGPLRRAVI